jgi:hypothetical protein
MQLFLASPVKLFYQVSLAIALVGCGFTSDDNSLTTVEGSITNRYTNLPVVAAPVTVGLRSTGIGYRDYDSLTTVYSDATGHYSVSFNTPEQHKDLIHEEYIVHVLHSTDLFDLTNQPGSYPWNGTVIKRGKANSINLEVTPYKEVTIRMPAGKSGRNSIHLDFYSTDRENWFGNIILSDTNRTNQFIALTRIIKVLPNRSYRFNRQLVGKGVTIVDSQERRVLYNDTTTILFQ